MAPAPSSVLIPGGHTEVGTKSPLLPLDGEGPVRQVDLRPFRLCETAVTNAEFSDLVVATGYVTEAERYRVRWGNSRGCSGAGNGNSLALCM
ncbi:SUMF1/EgtB/PvdO family nonheme iron enzyme [Devosia sp. PTR5]|uniref:SUMF1/EgtB/PvdO family nonheme iron enzyme n=1 Tax=Devosia oryzisoli TaxID=2774138 RepID=A0A927FXS4_9HYPH|nr:SUMF1/EgtB/PvdO family nonheme iron enzyme [Devosia oryzisoli]MBD8065961.1 SUMF1/EgtB/PvdO family nonheme iron enzyme [Devosia oryzisoli]